MSYYTYVGPYYSCKRVTPVDDFNESTDVLRDALTFAFFDGQYHYWINNMKIGDGEGRKFELSDDGEVALHLYPRLISDECVDFSVAHADTKEVLERYYGKGNVVLQWGVVRYHM